MPLENPEGREQVRLLPLWPTLRTACQFPWQHRRQVERLLVIPVALSVLLWVLGMYWVEGTDTSPGGALLYLALSQLPIVAFTYFAVSYHRLILMGEHSISRFGVPGWTMRETRFLFWIIIIYLVTALFVFLITLALGIVSLTVAGIMGEAVVQQPVYRMIIGTVVLIAWAYYVGRMSLVLPAVAIDLRPSFNSALSLSEGNEWRVALIVGGIPIAFWGFFALISWITGGLQEMSGEAVSLGLDFPSIGGLGLQQFLYYVWLTIEVAILSFTYRFLAQNMESTAPSPELPDFPS